MLNQEDNSITGEVLFNRIQNHETDDNVHKYVGKVRDMYTSTTFCKYEEKDRLVTNERGVGRDREGYCRKVT